MTACVNHDIKAFGINGEWKNVAKNAGRSCEMVKDAAEIFMT